MPQVAGRQLRTPRAAWRRRIGRPVTESSLSLRVPARRAAVYARPTRTWSPWSIRA